MDLSKRQISLSQKYFEPDSYKLKFINHLTTIGAANIIAKTILAPLQRWRVISQVQTAYPLRPKKFKNFFDFLKRIPKEQGIKSFWRGNLLHCWIYFHQSFFQIVLFDNVNALKRLWLEQSQQLPWLQEIQKKIFIPFLTSIFAMSIIYPIDTYRIQTIMSYHKNSSDAPFKKFRHFVSEINSFQNLYKGFWIGVLMSIIQFNFYKNVGMLIKKIDYLQNGQDSWKSQIFSPELISSVLAVGLLHPLDTFRKMLQFNNMYKPSIFTAYRAVFERLRANNNFGSLYNGFMVSILRTTLFVPLFWIIFKKMNQNPIEQNLNKD